MAGKNDAECEDPIEIVGEFVIDADIERVRRYAGDLKLQYALLNKYRYKKAHIEQVGQGRYRVHTEAQGIIVDSIISVGENEDDTITQQILLNIKALGMRFQELPCTLKCVLEPQNGKTRVNATMTVRAGLDRMRRNLLKFGLEKEMQSEYNRLRFYIENGEV